MFTVTVCGSMKFKKQIQDISYQLATSGICVLQPMYSNNDDITFTIEMKDNLMKTHFHKIEMSDAILVVDINGYVGEHTQMEIEHAKKNGILVLYSRDYSSFSEPILYDIKKELIECIQNDPSMIYHSIDTLMNRMSDIEDLIHRISITKDV